ncbi:MAG TPA: putative porin [Pyrinomonadaceae bacterium]|nr:putative porin [Pyrinomonadaceae bacterium]
MRQLILRAASLCAFAFALAANAAAQTPADDTARPAQPATQSAATQSKPAGGLFALEEVERQLREQREEIEQLRAALREQSRLIGDLRTRVEETERAFAAGAAPSAVVREASYAADAATAGTTGKGAATAGAASPAGAAQDSKLEARVKAVEEQTKKTGDAISRQLGSLTFSGDLRFRYESFYGQENVLASAENPGTFGNPLSTRQRFRLRARFGVRGRISDEFDWGIRLATGSYADVISTNATLTDFFTRKPFALDQAYINYRPKSLQGKQHVFQLQLGKFDTPWTRTELTWDNDISVEGLSESYTYNFKKSAFKSLGLVAWQLPMLERNSAFVLGTDGHIDPNASGRAGRDLELYGAQARTEIASKNVSVKLSASDLYFSGTQFITPAQVFGVNVQFPVTVVIPASGTSPARTVTTQVSFPRDLLVAGNANLGLSLANTNAVNRDGRLSSGFNLVDLIARADFNQSKKWPVMLLFNFVTNTQAHDVVTAGASGADVLLRNDQGQGYWAEFQVGKDLLRLSPDRIKRGDPFFNYAFIRVEKDAILSPFNGSDLGQSTDMRVHRFFVGYALDPRVALTLTGFFTQRPTGLLGAFGQTPPGSLNRTQTRLQLDTVLRF